MDAENGRIHKHVKKWTIGPINNNVSLECVARVIAIGLKGKRVAIATCETPRALLPAGLVVCKYKGLFICRETSQAALYLRSDWL